MAFLFQKGGEEDIVFFLVGIIFFHGKEVRNGIVISSW
jgi:hypothetical protein